MGVKKINFKGSNEKKFIASDVYRFYPQFHLQ